MITYTFVYNSLYCDYYKVYQRIKNLEDDLSTANETDEKQIEPMYTMTSDVADHQLSDIERVIPMKDTFNVEIENMHNQYSESNIYNRESV